MVSHIPSNKKPIIQLMATMLLSSISLPVITYGQADNLPATSAEVRQEIEEKLAAQPDDPLANYLYGFWQLAELAESDEFQAMMVSMGMPSSFHDLTVFDEEIPSSENAETNQQFQPSELRAYCVDKLLPVLDALGNRLATLGEDQTIQLSNEYYGLENDIIIDCVDSLVLRSLVKAYTFLIRIQLAYNWELQVSSLVKLDNNGLGSAESLRDVASNFGAVYDTALLAQAGEDLKSAINFYQEASPLLRSSTRKVGLIVLDANDFEEEVEFFDQLYKVKSTLDGGQAWGTSDPVTVNLQPFFEGKVDFSLLLPDSVGNQFVNTIPDPTFGGILPNMTAQELLSHGLSSGIVTDNLWSGAKALEPYNWWAQSAGDAGAVAAAGAAAEAAALAAGDTAAEAAAAGAAAGAVQAAIDAAAAGNWWISHWFGMFWRQNPANWWDYEAGVFPSDWLYHQWLGWVYPISTTPKNIWFWQQNTGHWIWTSSRFFPVLFYLTEGGWFYISGTDGSYYLWDGSKWIAKEG